VFDAEHLVWVNASDAQSDTGIGDLYFSESIRWRLMRHNCVPVGEGVGYEIVVGHLQECVYGGGCVLLLGYPIAYGCERGENGGVRMQKESGAAFFSPLGQLIVTRFEFVAYLLNAENVSRAILDVKPFPKCGAEIEAVVSILGLDEYVGVQQVGHQM